MYKPNNPLDRKRLYVQAETHEWESSWLPIPKRPQPRHSEVSMSLKKNIGSSNYKMWVSALSSEKNRYELVVLIVDALD